MASCGLPPTRFWVAIMVFFSTFMNYMLRYNISVSIIAMVVPKEKNSTPECGYQSGFSGGRHEISVQTQYEWSEHVQALILGAYFWGYVITNLPAGFIAEWIGPSTAIIVTSLIAAIFQSLTVFAATFHWGAVIICRVVIGIMGGITYPALNCLIARWAPPAEKGKFFGCLMGNTIGNVFTWTCVAFVTDAWGWEWGYHFCSLAVIVYVIFFWFLVSNAPQTHPRISPSELQYILDAQAGSVSTKKAVPPYKRIFLSIRVWALIVAQFGNMWSIAIISQLVPKYLSQVLGFDIKNSAVLAGTPYLARFFSGMAFGFVGDMLKNRQYFQVTTIRKSVPILSHVCPAICILSIAIVGCQPWAVICLLIVSQIFNASVVMGHLINGQDLAPNFAGTLYGIHSFFGGLSGFAVPSINAVFTEGRNNVEGWSYGYYTGAALITVCGILFTLFGTGEIQPWNEKKSSDNE